MQTLAFTIVILACLVQVARADSKWPLWEGYADHFIQGDGRVIDHDAQERTTSEAQAYALFFSLVANDRVRFHRLLNWTTQNLSQGDLGSHLPAWQWKADGFWRRSDQHSASDADLWLAYTLLSAGRFWNERQLTRTGSDLARRIAVEEVVTIPAFGAALMPGSFGFTTGDGSYELNASYLPIQLLLGLTTELHDHAWRDIAAGVPRIAKASARSGFVTDWIAFRTGDGFSNYPAPVAEPLASYDAIRFYLWAGMLDRFTPFRSEVVASTMGMIHYLQAHASPPAVVSVSGEVRNAEGSVGFSAAVLPLLASLGLQSEMRRQQRRLQHERNEKTGLFGESPRYYDQNLALFGTGWCEGRFKFDSSGLLKVSWN